jgi:hypothetical protein
MNFKLSGGNAQAKLSSYTYNGTNLFTIPFNDVYSDDGYTTLTIGIFDEAGKLDRFPTCCMNLKKIGITGTRYYQEIIDTWEEYKRDDIKYSKTVQAQIMHFKSFI